MLLIKKNDKFALHLKKLIMYNIQDIIIPLAGMLIGIVIPLAIFLWLYHENKNKYAAVVEISKNLDDPSKDEELINLV